MNIQLHGQILFPLYGKKMIPMLAVHTWIHNTKDPYKCLWRNISFKEWFSSFWNLYNIEVSTTWSSLLKIDLTLLKNLYHIDDSTTWPLYGSKLIHMLAAHQHITQKIRPNVTEELYILKSAWPVCWIYITLKSHAHGLMLLQIYGIKHILMLSVHKHNTLNIHPNFIE